MILRNRFDLSLSKARKPAGWLLALAMSTSMVAAIAVQDGNSVTAPDPCGPEMRGAVEAALRTHQGIVSGYMNEATRGMQDAVSPQNKCIGNLSLLNFDLSNMIPDFGLVGAILGAAVDRLVNGVINRACNAVSDVVQGAGGTWNSAVNTINGNLNTEGKIQTWGDGINYKVNAAVAGVSFAGSSGSGSSTAPVTPPPAAPAVPVTCYTLINGTFCTDGSTPASSTQPANNPTTVGAYVGADTARLVQACTEAISTWKQQTLNREGVVVNNDRSGVDAACGELQRFVNANAQLIPAGSIPYIPDYPISLPVVSSPSPPALSSSVQEQGAAGSTYSLPVRP